MAAAVLTEVEDDRAVEAEGVVTAVATVMIAGEDGRAMLTTIREDCKEELRCFEVLRHMVVR